MEEVIPFCLRSSLFRGVGEKDIRPLLKGLRAEKRAYKKGEFLFRAGDKAELFGLVLSGRIDTVYYDAFGGSSIIGTFEQGTLFSDAFACSDLEELPVDVVAQVASEVLLMDMGRLLGEGGVSEASKVSLALNLSRILANKYVDISRKMLHLSGRFTRQKLLSFLSEQSRLAKGKSFLMPMNMQQLSDYLFVDRTGLSEEWNKLKREGILIQENGLYDLRKKPCVGQDCGENKKR